MSEIQAERQAVGQATATLRQLRQLVRSQLSEVSRLSADVKRVTGTTSTSADQKMLTTLQAGTAHLNAVMQRINVAVSQAEDIARRL